MKTTTAPTNCEPFALERDPVTNAIIPESKFLDAGGWIHVTNADDPNATNIFPGERRRRVKACEGFRVGPPRPTTSEVHGQFKNLVAAGIVGLYGPPIYADEKDKGKQP